MLFEKNSFWDPKKYDRESVNESDGQHFYGYDDEETEKTVWCDEDGNTDSITNIPNGIWDWLFNSD